MQTFLPCDTFSESAEVLDRARLGKQRVEAKQIVLALRDPSYGWQNHPAVKMWRGYEEALLLYGSIICHEWKQRGYKDSLLPFFHDQRGFRAALIFPPWLGDEAFHASHRSNLLRKDPAHYRTYWPDEPADLPYVWPAGSAA